ncbi:TauD/TfdA family dioxygenase [Burkholderia sp. WSM2232]|uniref:TauD/TfdA family dioxygenase n=1 Tax=Burkholderia sp. WSM2232 TaxID=944436 RepID=UPI000483545E|nr:TauD/TfdA family dioxygenase [Burkholderia sp. WSM2232]
MREGIDMSRVGICQPPSEREFSLDDASRDELRKAISQKIRCGFDRKSNEFAKAIRGAGIPVDCIKRQLFETDEPFFILRNLPVDQPSEKWVTSDAPYASAILAGLTGSVGLSNFGYREEKGGAILHDIYPIPGSESAQSNAGRIEFGFHVDNPFLPRVGRPEVLTLVSINNDSNAATHLLTIGEIKRSLSPETLSVLRQPLFDFRHADSFNLNKYKIFATNSPVVKTVDGFDEIRWAVFTLSTDERARAAITELKALAHATCRRIVLQPGELLIFNNNRCIHGRGEVAGWRWLKRIYGTRHESVIGADDLMSAWDLLSTDSVDHTF